MPKRMLIDASHPEETRVVVLDGQKVEEFDFEAASKRPLKGNIYLAKVTRVEPSLQAAFVEYGGNRQGFLAFSEIHPDYYQIPVADRLALLAEQEAEARRRTDDDVESFEITSGPKPESQTEFDENEVIEITNADDEAEAEEQHEQVETNPVDDNQADEVAPAFSREDRFESIHVDPAEGATPENLPISDDVGDTDPFVEQPDASTEDAEHVEGLAETFGTESGPIDLLDASQDTATGDPQPGGEVSEGENAAAPTTPSPRPLPP